MLTWRLCHWPAAEIQYYSNRASFVLNPGHSFCVQASERVPISVCGIHCTVTILAWVGVATAKGDYRYRPPNFLFGAQQKAMLLACFSGALTWVGQNLHVVPPNPLSTPDMHTSKWHCSVDAAERLHTKAGVRSVIWGLYEMTMYLAEPTHLLCHTQCAIQALFVPTVLAGYASMVTHHVLDSSLLVQHGHGQQLPPQVCPSSSSCLCPAVRCVDETTTGCSCCFPGRCMDALLWRHLYHLLAGL